MPKIFQTFWILQKQWRKLLWIQGRIWCVEKVLLFIFPVKKEKYWISRPYLMCRWSTSVHSCSKNFQKKKIWRIQNTVQDEAQSFMGANTSSNRKIMLIFGAAIQSVSSLSWDLRAGEPEISEMLYVFGSFLKMALSTLLAKGYVIHKSYGDQLLLISICWHSIFPLGTGHNVFGNNKRGNTGYLMIP